MACLGSSRWKLNSLDGSEKGFKTCNGIRIPDSVMSADANEIIKLERCLDALVAKVEVHVQACADATVREEQSFFGLID